MKHKKKITQAKKLKHIEALKAIVLSHDFKKDKFDNYNRKELRIRFKNISLIIESKGAYVGYMNIQTKRLQNVTEKELNSFLSFI